MSKKILVISTSPRKGGNSDALADEFVRGAQEAGNQVEKVTLYDKTIGFCRGCLTCQSTGHCVIRDDAAAIARKMGGGGCHRICHAHLLLRHVRTDEDHAGPGQSAFCS